MEKKFEEKFGLKTEEMKEIFGGVVGPKSLQGGNGGICDICCVMCVGCYDDCFFCVIEVF